MEDGRQVDHVTYRTGSSIFVMMKLLSRSLLRWWDPTDVDYGEILNLAKVNAEERSGIRIQCQQVEKDGREWM